MKFSKVSGSFFNFFASHRCRRDFPQSVGALYRSYYVFKVKISHNPATFLPKAYIQPFFPKCPTLTVVIWFWRPDFAPLTYVHALFFKVSKPKNKKATSGQLTGNGFSRTGETVISCPVSLFLFYNSANLSQDGRYQNME